MKKLCWAFMALLLILPSSLAAQVHKNNVAVCGSSTGYSYYANRGIAEGDILGWSEEKNLTGSITFKKYDDGKLDLIFVDATKGSYSSTEEGAAIIPASISETSASIISLYPNKLSETYIFQKLKDGKMQVMWTQAKSDTPLPKIAAWVGECSYLNLDLLTDK